MSNIFSDFGGTLTTGIQDLSALLPILGTEQCEKHIGSALEGGYIYASATILSIFGSLGIVKAGAAVLIASISIPKLTLSLTLFPKPSLGFTSSRQRWLGARLLKNAGIELVGMVAPKIGISSSTQQETQSYVAEAGLLQMLKDKHIDNGLDRWSVKFKTIKWNIGLILSMLLAAVTSGIPYIHLIKADISLHSSWIFPFLRTIGSCFAAISIQFIIQSRIMLLMRSRLVFMIMHQFLINELKEQRIENPELLLNQQQEFKWNSTFPAEECLWSLEQYLYYSVQAGNAQPPALIPSSPKLINVQSNLDATASNHVSLPMTPIDFANPEQILQKLDELYQEHFPSPSADQLFLLVSWTLLLIGIPAIIVGYVGCFTLVANSQKPQGPIIWLALEATLSILRILLWASNPSFDERTSVSLYLKPTGHPPLVTMEKPDDFPNKTGSILDLVAEHEFLEHVASYTGHVEQFKWRGNITLYFTLTGVQSEEFEHQCLYMTVIDNEHTGTAFTIHQTAEFPHVIGSVINTDGDTGKLQAILQSSIHESHPRRSSHPLLFNDLFKYYYTLLHALGNHTQLQNITSNQSSHLIMKFVPVPHFSQWKWSLLPKLHKEHNHYPISSYIGSPPLSEHDKLYLQRGYEHQLKTQLIGNWGEWIATGMKYWRDKALQDCHKVLAGQIGEELEAKQELIELDFQLIREWGQRELNLIKCSMQLENILNQKMTKCIRNIVRACGDEWLGERLTSEWMTKQRKRLNKEHRQAKERIQKQRQLHASMEEVEMERQVQKNHDNSLSLQYYDVRRILWSDTEKFIDGRWAAVIQNDIAALQTAVPDLADLIHKHEFDVSLLLYRINWQQRFQVTEQLRLRLACWNSQHSKEQCEMELTIKDIREASDLETLAATDSSLGEAYEYPKPYEDLVSAVHSGYADLRLDSFRPTTAAKKDLRAFAARLSTATVYDVRHCGSADVLHDVFENNSTRTVIGVPKDMIQDIPIQNDHVFYISSESGEQITPAFIQQNHNQWWEEQTQNSSIFYLSPQVDSLPQRSQYAYYCYNGRMANIMVFIQTPVRLRLKLLHSLQSGSASISIQDQDGQKLHVVHSDAIPRELSLNTIELGLFDEGKYELELVIAWADSGSSKLQTRRSRIYHLNDIYVEFVNEVPSQSSYEDMGLDSDEDRSFIDQDVPESPILAWRDEIPLSATEEDEPRIIDDSFSESESFDAENAGSREKKTGGKTEIEYEPSEEVMIHAEQSKRLTASMAEKTGAEVEIEFEPSEEVKNHAEDV